MPDSVSMLRIVLIYMLIFLPLQAYSQPSVNQGKQLPIKDFVLERPILAPSLAIYNKDNTVNAIQYPVTLVNFWHTECTICVDQLSTLNALQKDMKDTGVRVLTVLVDDKPVAEMKAFYTEHPFKYLKKYRDSAKDVFKRFGASEVPSTYVINQKGYIVAGVVGAYDWNTYEVQQYLKELGK